MSPQENYGATVIGIVRSIIEPTMAANGEVADVLELLECVVAGVLLSTVIPGGDEPVLNAFIGLVRERMADMRLAMIEPAGEA